MNLLFNLCWLLFLCKFSLSKYGNVFLFNMHLNIAGLLLLYQKY